MKACCLTIVTTVDGRESVLSLKAEMELLPLSAILCYHTQEGGFVRMFFAQDSVQINRDGDYALSFVLVEGGRTKGTLGFGDSMGELTVETQKIAYTISNRSLLALLKYTLDFGTEKQEMSLRITAKEEISEEK